MDYNEFIQNKKHSIGNFGFEANYIPEIAFDFQKFIIEKAVRKGRIAVFADTGLGKTLIQLSIAKNIIQHTNKKVLILTPLAVAFQFILEAEKIRKMINKRFYLTSNQPLKFLKKIMKCAGKTFFKKLEYNVRCFTFGLRSVALWEGQTDVKAFVSGVGGLCGCPFRFLLFYFLREGLIC